MLVKAGREDALIDRLISLDEDYIADFLMTHCYFISDRDLFEHLVDRYRTYLKCGKASFSRVIRYL